MNRIARRLVGTAVPAVSALAAVVAFGAPAHAAVATTVLWEPGADYVRIQLNDEALNAALNYDSYLGVGIDDVCGQISDFVNGKRAAAGYTTKFGSRDCVTYVRHCAETRTNDAVEVDVYADLTWSCRSYA